MLRKTMEALVPVFSETVGNLFPSSDQEKASSRTVLRTIIFLISHFSAWVVRNLHEGV